MRKVQNELLGNRKTNQSFIKIAKKNFFLNFKKKRIVQFGLEMEILSY